MSGIYVPAGEAHVATRAAPRWCDSVTDGQTIFASSFNEKVYAIDGATDQLRWVTPLAPDSTKPSTFGPMLYDGVVYVILKRFARVSQSGALAALDAATGRVLWQREFLPKNPGQWT